MPKATILDKFCPCCRRGFKSDADVERHIQNSQEPTHVAFRSAGLRRRGRPSDPLPSELDDIHGDQENEEDADLDMLDVLGLSDPEDDAAAEQRNATHAAHLSAMDDEPVIDVFPGEPARIKRYDPSPHADFETAWRSSGLPFYPFHSKFEYEFAQWLKSESISNAALDRLMKIDQVQESLGLSFANARQLHQLIAKIPCRAPFQRTELHVDGAPEKLYVIHRDTQAALRELWSRLNLQGKIALVPERRYTDASRRVRLYCEFHTGTWMWTIQEKLPEGATAVPIQIFVDKTQLCQLVGVECNTAYPVYLTISTISPELLADVSSNAHILVGFVSTGEFDVPELSSEEERNLRLRVFHESMRVMLEPLQRASREGMELTSADGAVRDAYPILAIDNLDNPEQCQHALCRFGRACPNCKATKDDFSKSSAAEPRTQEDTIRHIEHAATLGNLRAINDYLKQHGLNFVLEPFWKDWAHVNIHQAITPDILHQLYQGMIKHLVKWLQKLVGKKELDARFERQAPMHGLRHFDKGISVLQRVSGTEHKAIAAQLLPCTASASIDRRAVRCTRALLDVTMMSQYECHSDDTIDDLKDAITAFHEDKHVFLETGACKSLDLPKLHAMHHYPDAIRLFGSLNKCNTEIGERLHIDYTKDAYAASNKKRDQILAQMCKWVDNGLSMRYIARFFAFKTGTTYDARKRPPRKQGQDPIVFTKRPSGGRMAVAELTATNGADGLADAMQSFIEDHCYKEWRKTYPRKPVPPLPTIKSSMPLNVWNSMKFNTPDLQTLYAKDTHDVAYARPKRSKAKQHARHRKPEPPTATDTSSDDEDMSSNDEDMSSSTDSTSSDESSSSGEESSEETTSASKGIVPARFSPVFIKPNERAGDSGTRGLRVGHLRAIFELPAPVVASIKRLGIAPPADKLAFVQWFTRLGRRDADTRMFRVSRDMRTGSGVGRDKQRNVSVIDATTIRRSCHLSPVLDRRTPSIPRHLTAESVIEDWDGEFWVNNYADKPLYRSML